MYEYEQCDWPNHNDHIDVVWGMRRNDPRAAAMRPYVKLLRLLVFIRTGAT